LHDEDPEVSSLFSEAPLNDAYNVPYTSDPYAAFDPDMSATSEDDNREPAESGSAQRSFKKIGEQWGAMVTDHGRSHKDRRGHYSEEKGGRRGGFSRQRNRGGRRRSVATRSPSVTSPELSVQRESVGASRVVRLVSEEVQTAAEDVVLSSPVAAENNVVPDDRTLHGVADSRVIDREMVDCEVQCSPKTADSLRKEYIRLSAVLCFKFVFSRPW